MQLFKLKTQLSRFDTFAQFATEFSLSAKDLIITNEFLAEPYMKSLKLPCHFIWQEKYGQGEPSDQMMNAILDEVKKIDYDRVIAIGGGTVIDIAKLFVLKDLSNVVDAFERTIPLEKEKLLVVIPTTCGTGSEVTNITIAEIKSKQTKMGLADDALMPDHAVIIPEFLSGLPFKYYAASAIDALIHAVESYVSPRANSYTRLYSKAAIGIILDVFVNIAQKGEAYRMERLEDMLIASNFAGIAFGNAGVGAVHALSYPLGGTYHVSHGEANYQFFIPVFEKYLEKKPQGALRDLNVFMAETLKVAPGQVYGELDALLGKLLPKNKLRYYGMKESECEVFAESVLQKQGRLLANNYVELSKAEITAIFQ
ncbi:MAG: 4-hydroxybutyrate dehydrogenase, partial [Bacteroidota bacterium]